MCLWYGCCLLGYILSCISSYKTAHLTASILSYNPPFCCATDFGCLWLMFVVFCTIQYAGTIAKFNLLGTAPTYFEPLARLFGAYKAHLVLVIFLSRCATTIACITISTPYVIKLLLGTYFSLFLLKLIAYLACTTTFMSNILSTLNMNYNMTKLCIHSLCNRNRLGSTYYTFH